MPLKKVPVRVAKYDVELRDAPLRASQAMHAILSRMVLFTCNDCRERFPTFHPAFVPPPAIANEMEILKRGKNGVAACSVEVATWDELPPLHPSDGVASRCTGRCHRCQKDEEDQMRNLAAADCDGGQIVLLRSSDNHMDPCFRFPWHDLQDLFAKATVTEAMLVSLDHMQVNFVQVSTTGLRKFRRNTLSFPQDVARFSEKLDLMKGYRVDDRVNSARGIGVDPRNPDREVLRATGGTPEEREKYCVDAGGCLIFPGRIVEVRPDGLVVVEYDGGLGQGLERVENVRPRQLMPWHPRDVPMHIMLRRNVGKGKAPVEGLTVRWSVVAQLLQALCAYSRKGYPWRRGGGEREPMHQYYDPRMFDVMDDPDDLRVRYAPKVRDGVTLEPEEVVALSSAEKLELATDVSSTEHLVAAGFNVQFVGPECGLSATLREGKDIHEQQTGEHDDEPTVEGGGEADGSAAAVAGGEEEDASDVLGEDADAECGLYVEEETFCIWLDRTEYSYGMSVARWFVGLDVVEEGGSEEAVKKADDETTVDLFRRIMEDLKLQAKEEGQETRRYPLVKDGMVFLPKMVEWFEKHIGFGLGLQVEQRECSRDMVMDDVLHELVLADVGRGGGLTQDKGLMRDDADQPDEEEDALHIAQRLVYGWPNKNEEPTGACTRGRFVKSFPLEFPMGIADLFEERPHKVSPEDWVQHLLRYWNGQFVGGERGQRVMWAMVNTLLLSEARSRGFGIYRNVMRRVGFGLQGGRVLTKRELRGILEKEDHMRVLVSQLSTVGRDVRSTTMHWAYEGKKLDSTVKHMSWVPPWVRHRDVNGGAVESPGARFMDENAGDVRVDDNVGLGRHPSLWWTLNCKYNAAYDVQRLNTDGTAGRAGLRTRGEGDKEERFDFARDNPDLVAYEMALRTELHMRMVMPAIVPHSEDWPYMTMARFETGPGGNPHYHGFSMGKPGPVVKRVKADVAGADDLPPRTMTEDVRVVRRAMLVEGGPMEWDYGDAWSRSKVLERVEEVMVAEDETQRIDGEEVPVGAQDADIVPGHEFARGRVSAVVEFLVETGVLRELRGECVGEVSDVRYVLVPPAPPVPEVEPAKRKGWHWGDRQKNMTGAVVDLGILKPEEEGQQLQSSLEQQFAEFFEGIVSEWNPCFSSDGRWRYKWDSEIGAHDVDLEVDPLDEGDLPAAEAVAFQKRQAERSSE